MSMFSTVPSSRLVSAAIQRHALGLRLLLRANQVLLERRFARPVHIPRFDAMRFAAFCVAHDIPADIARSIAVLHQ